MNGRIILEFSNSTSYSVNSDCYLSADLSAKAADLKIASGFNFRRPTGDQHPAHQVASDDVPYVYPYSDSEEGHRSFPEIITSTFRQTIFI